MIRQVIVAASIALLGISGQAVAAQSAKLANVSGSVLVNQDGRFVPTKGATALRAGDRVLAMNGGGTLTYANGCTTTVVPHSMVTINDGACGGAKVVKAQYTEGQVGTYNGQEGTYHRDGDFWVFIAFGVLTAAVTIAAFNDDDQPVSP
jgi:hypothetical protein